MFSLIRHLIPEKNRKITETSGIAFDKQVKRHYYTTIRGTNSEFFSSMNLLKTTEAAAIGIHAAVLMAADEAETFSENTTLAMVAGKMPTPELAIK